MLKLNNRNNAIIICFVTAFIFNCAGEKKNFSEQKKSTDTLSINAGEIKNQSVADSGQNIFSFSIEGYKATQLGQAVYENDTAKIQTIINSGASIEKCLTDETYIFDILYAAIAYKRIESIRFVLNNKLFTSINKVYTEDSETPLTLACALTNGKDALEIANSLIALGALVNGVGESGGEQTKYPFFIAVKQNNIPLVKLLIEHGAKIDIKNAGGESPLNIAEKNGFEEMVNLLKEKQK